MNLFLGVIINIIVTVTIKIGCLWPRGLLSCPHSVL